MTREAYAPYGGGSMSERSPGVWRLRVMTKDASGKAKQVQETFRGTKTEAQKRLRSMDPKPIEAATGERTFGDLLDAWIDFKKKAKKKGWAANTLQANTSAVDQRIRPRLGHIPLADLTAHNLDMAYVAWEAEGLSESSVHRYHAVISAALGQAFKWGWVDTNVARRATAPTQPESKALEATADQVGLLIHAAEDHEGNFDGRTMAALIALAFVTGARRGELLALHWSDVDMEAGTIRFDKALAEVAGEVLEKGTKTGKDKAVVLDDRSLEVLRRHQAWQQYVSDEAESPLVSDPYIFSDNANAATAIVPSKVTDRFTVIRKAAGIRPVTKTVAGQKVRRCVTFHSLRHGNASAQLAAGINPVDVSASLGHSSTRTTLDTYAHSLPTAGKAGAAVMGALLPES